MADNLDDEKGDGAIISFVDPKEGLKGATKIDIFLFLLRLTESGKPINPVSAEEKYLYSGNGADAAAAVFGGVKRQEYFLIYDKGRRSKCRLLIIVKGIK